MPGDRPRVKAATAPLAVFVVALAARALTGAAITFPIPEGSAYYVAAARNLATGRGLVVDVLWSYATPPLQVPRPAFDLWQPLASLLAAPVMAVVGPSLAAAQSVSVLLGALVAVAAWAIARDAGRELGLPPARAGSVALAAGLLVALTPLLLVQSAEPDSSAPFTVLALTACWLASRALAERQPALGWRLSLGVALGLAYLARQEAIYVAIGYVVLVWLDGRASGLRRAFPVLGAAALVVAPWLLRQATTWDASPFGQVLENAWSVGYGDVFAWSARPTLARYLALGLPSLIGMRLEGVVGNGALLVLTAFPSAAIGLATLLAWPRLIAAAPLRLLTIAALLTFAVDVLVFPVPEWRALYAHGAGPTIVLLAVLASLGTDRLVARLGAFRGWRPATHRLALGALLPPVALVSLALPFAVLAASFEHERSTELGAEYGALAADASGWDVPPGGPIVSDHPMWVNAALDRPAVVLPREGPAAIVDLARYFGAIAVAVRTADSADLAAALAAYRGPDGEACFAPLPAPPPFIALAFTCPAP
jgi:hypothetical protein